jgi:hypothetical protein
VVPHTLPPTLSALATLFSESEEAGRQQAHFVAAGHMRELQLLRVNADSELKRAIDALNGTFPEDVVTQLQPNYEQTLLDRIGDEEGTG